MSRPVGSYPISVIVADRILLTGVTESWWTGNCPRMKGFPTNIMEAIRTDGGGE